MFQGVQIPPLRAPLVTASGAARMARSFLLLSITLSIGGFACGQRRDFAATYAVTHVTEAERGVELTLTLTVHNYSGRDIEDCGIVLNASDHFATPIGNFEPIRLLASDRDLTLQHSFAVPRSEYERWQRGVAPVLELLVPDGEGGTRVMAIQALRAVPLPADPAD